MKMLIATILAIAIISGALALSPDLRERAEDVLFQPDGNELTEDAPEARPSPAGQTDTAEQARHDGSAAPVPPAGEDDPAPETRAPQPPTAAEQQAQPAPETPGTPGEQTARLRLPDPPDPQEGRQPNARITLPPPLHNVRWGMTEPQVRRLYPISWESTDYTGSAGTRTLTHYMTADRTQSARFRLEGDSLFEIVVQLNPGQGETLEGLYEHWRERLGRQYAGVAETGRTRWSDGTTRVSIGVDRARNYVSISFTCPAARN